MLFGKTNDKAQPYAKKAPRRRKTDFTLFLIRLILTLLPR